MIEARLGGIGGADVTDVTVEIGAEPAVGVGGSVGAGIETGVGVGIGVEFSGIGVTGCGCVGGVGGTGEIDGPIFVVMATASVIGVAACAVTVVGVAGETSTRCAVLFTFASCGGAGFGGGLSP